MWENLFIKYREILIQYHKSILYWKYNSRSNYDSSYIKNRIPISLRNPNRNQIATPLWLEVIIIFSKILNHTWNQSNFSIITTFTWIQVPEYIYETFAPSNLETGKSLCPFLHEPIKNAPYGSYEYIITINSVDRVTTSDLP